jgi:putative ABC transport system permease protein
MTDLAENKRFAFFWHMSWRMLWRDWRGGELSILAAGLVIAVTSITAVGFFTDRIERGLQQQSAELIGADLVITSGRPEVADYLEDTRAHGFQVATTQQFRSVVLAKQRPQLVEVKAVSEDYPLRGVLRISDSAFGADEATTRIPAAGDVWVEARLLQLLDLQVGDEISLGATTFTLRKLLRYEPDRAGDMFSVAPRVQIWMPPN